MAYLLDTCRANYPHRPVNWRWERARLLARYRRTTPARQADDDWVDQACLLRYGLLHAGCIGDRDWEIQQAGDMGVAYLLSGEDILLEAATQPATPVPRVRSPARDELEARILTGAPFADTAQAMGTTPEVIAAYEKVFFNVVERLEVFGFIMHQAIGPGLHDGTGDVGAVWKLLGWRTRSPRFLEQIISGCLSPTAGSDPGADALGCAAANTAWARFVKALGATLTMPVNAKTQRQLLQLYKHLPTTGKEEANKVQEAFAENLKEAFGVMKWMAGVPTAMVGQSGEPRAHELLQEALEIKKISEIHNDFQWPEPKPPQPGA